MQSSVIAAVACFLKIEIKDFCKKNKLLPEFQPCQLCFEQWHCHHADVFQV